MSFKNKPVIRNSIKFLILIVFFFGCQSDQIQYEYVVFYEGDIKFLRDRIENEYKDKMEKGEFLIDSQEGDTLKSGLFRNGFKVGEWKYCSSKTKTISVNWLKYSSKDNLVETNYPQEWDIIESNSTLFQAAIPSNSLIKDDKYFVILEHNKQDLEIDLQDYWNLLNKETHSSDSVESHMFRKFSREDGVFYLSTYTIKRNSERLFLISFLGESEQSIYDITYSTLKEDKDKNYVILLDLIQSLRVEGQRFFTPFGQSTKITNLEWPMDTEIIS
jgi:hypothetical protein